MKLPAFEKGKPEEKAERIVAAAKELFFEFGYKRTSVSDITERAGVAKGTFYIYFPSKAEIMREIWLAEIRWAMDMLFGKMKEIKGARNQIHFFLNSILNVTHETKSFIGKFLSRRQDFLDAMEELGHKTAECVHDDFTQRLSVIIKAGIDSKEFKPVDPMKVSGVLRSMMFLALFMDKVEHVALMKKSEFVDVLTDLLIGGLERCKEKI